MKLSLHFSFLNPFLQQVTVTNLVHIPRTTIVIEFYVDVVDI